MADEDHNIGANGNEGMFSDDEPPVSNNCEDPTSNGCGQASITSSTWGLKKGSSVSPSGDRPSDLQPVQHIPVLNSNISIGKIGLKKDNSKARLKVEKIKQRKTAGWIESSNMEGHKEFAAVDDVLDFLGEAEDNEHSSHSSQQQKRKTKKRVKHKSNLKSDAVESRNGKMSATSSTTSDSDHGDGNPGGNRFNRSNDTLGMNGYIPSAPVADRNDGSSQSTASSAIGALENGLSSHSAEDNEFKQVQRKKKATPKQMDKVKPSISPTPARKSNKNGWRSHSVAAAYQAKALPPAEPVLSMDLSLNSFPMLESQSQFCDVRTCTPLESAQIAFTESTTDDDRDSVASLSTGCYRTTWARIAAKQSPVNPDPSFVTNPHQLNPSSRETGASVSSQQKGGTNGRPPGSSCNSGAATTARSTTSCSDFEFGTVTTSNDIGADRHVRDILSQSFNEEQTRLTLPSPKSVSNIAKVTSTDIRKKLNSLRRPQGKVVEFLDECRGQPRSSINVVFGFDNNDQLAQGNQTLTLDPEPVEHNPVTASAQKTASSTECHNRTPSSSNISAQSECLENSILPLVGDVLPHILSASYNGSAYSKQYCKHSHDLNGNFNLSNAVSMLKKEYDCVLELRKKYGNETVKFSAELLSN